MLARQIAGKNRTRQQVVAWTVASTRKSRSCRRNQNRTLPRDQPTTGQLDKSYILETHRQSLPSVLDSSALWSCGYWSASILLAAWAHTINAFIGLFTWAALLSPEPLQFEDIIFIGNNCFLRIQRVRGNERSFKNSRYQFQGNFQVINYRIFVARKDLCSEKRNVWMEDRNRDRGGSCDKEAASFSSNLIGIVGRLIFSAINFCAFIYELYFMRYHVAATAAMKSICTYPCFIIIR